MDFFNNDDSSDIQPEQSIIYVKGEQRITNPRLTRYEMVRIIGERTKQLTMGAKPLVKNFQDLSYEDILNQVFPVPNTLALKRKTDDWNWYEMKKNIEAYYVTVRIRK